MVFMTFNPLLSLSNKSRFLEEYLEYTFQSSSEFKSMPTKPNSSFHVTPFNPLLSLSFIEIYEDQNGQIFQSSSEFKSF